jgi:hypothetical protein
MASTDEAIMSITSESGGTYAVNFTQYNIDPTDRTELPQRFGHRIQSINGKPNTETMAATAKTFTLCIMCPLQVLSLRAF